jgi:hypothetical protein
VLQQQSRTLQSILYIKKANLDNPHITDGGGVLISPINIEAKLKTTTNTAITSQVAQ